MIQQNKEANIMKHKLQFSLLLFSITFLLVGTTPIYSQHHYDDWVHRNAMDTTIVQCRNDSLTMVGFPPNSMMGMMMPDSIFCRIERMPMDSLRHPYDSTFIGWHRMEIGRDSMHFDMMDDDSGMGNHHGMQFMMNIQCRLHWDSSMTDSMHRGWHPTGLRGWDGSKWVVIPNMSIVGNDGIGSTTQLYSTIAFVGEASQVTSVNEQANVLEKFNLHQNYPNPFNPTTEIRFTLPVTSNVVLKIYNILGNEVQTVIDNQPMSAGDHSIRVDASYLSSGVYFYTLRAGQFKSTQKMMLVR